MPGLRTDLRRSTLVVGDHGKTLELTVPFTGRLPQDIAGQLEHELRYAALSPAASKPSPRSVDFASRTESFVVSLQFRDADDAGQWVRWRETEPVSDRLIVAVQRAVGAAYAAVRAAAGPGGFSVDWTRSVSARVRRGVDESDQTIVSVPLLAPANLAAQLVPHRVLNAVLTQRLRVEWIGQSGLELVDVDVAHSPIGEVWLSYTIDGPRQERELLDELVRDLIDQGVHDLERLVDIEQAHSAESLR